MAEIMPADGESRIRGLYRLLAVYNGLVVFLMAGFMSITQEKIVSSMAARTFLSSLPIVPLPAAQGFLLAAGSFLLLVLLGFLYRRQSLRSGGQYVVFLAETGACVLLMRSLNLAYDGVVLLVVADLMHRYQGEKQSWLLVGAMSSPTTIWPSFRGMSRRLTPMPRTTGRRCRRGCWPSRTDLSPSI